ncbi:MAG: response regulator [Spartobacteria bacterium]|nr:response regulator [Spartobacteria bacterium]
MTRLLVVDDARYARKAIVNALRLVSDYEIVEYDNAKSALEAINRDPPDCVVTDLLMQDMDGLELLKQMKGITPAIPVIVITADIQEATRQQCLALGAAGFVKKSQIFKPDNGLAEVVAGILGGDEGDAAP